MTDYQTTTPTAAPQPSKTRNWLLPVSVGAGALVLGLAIGAAMVEPEVITETVEREVTVEVSSPDCLEALDLADQGFTIVADIMDSITRSDVSGIRSGNAELNDIAGDYNFTKATCRAGS